MVRSPHAHANILSIDLTAAKALPGVRSVITGECYKRRAGLYLEDKNFIAVGKARYRGEPVAAAPARKPQRAVRADKFPPPPVARDVQTGSVKRPSADVGGPKIKRETSILDIIMGN